MYMYTCMQDACHRPLCTCMYVNLWNTHQEGYWVVNWVFLHTSLVGTCPKSSSQFGGFWRIGTEWQRCLADYKSCNGSRSWISPCVVYAPSCINSAYINITFGINHISLGYIHNDKKCSHFKGMRQFQNI